MTEEAKDGVASHHYAATPPATRVMPFNDTDYFTRICRYTDRQRHEYRHAMPPRPPRHRRRSTPSLIVHTSAAFVHYQNKPIHPESSLNADDAACVARSPHQSAARRRRTSACRTWQQCVNMAR
jgi:hypothetical protein